MAGYIGFTAYAFANYASVFKHNKHFHLMYILISLLGVILAWSIPSYANTILIGLIFAVMVVYIVSSVF